MTQKNTLKVPTTIPSQLTQVRESGKANMFDRLAVQAAASDLKLYALVLWIQDHSVAEYASLAQGRFELED